MSIKYVVNKEKRTCVALLEDTERDAIVKINKMCNKDARFAEHAAMFVYNWADSPYLIPNRFVGVAKCAVEDEWDEETGKAIAKDRLLTKYHKTINKQILNFLDRMLYVADAFAEELERQ